MDNNCITVDLNNKISLKESIIKFKHKIINNDLGLINSEYNNFFLKEINGKTQKISEEDIKNTEILKEAFSISEIESIENAQKYYYACFSEAVVYSHLLEYPDLKQDAVDLALEIVNISKISEDTSDLWVDDCLVFGIDLLFILANKYPEYTYLISQYITRYWDTEHAPYAIDYLPSLLSKWSYNRDILKALAHCDNFELAVSIEYNQILDYFDKDDFNEFPLHDYFKNNKDEFTYFKNEYLKLAKANQILCETSKGVHYAEVFIKRISPDLSEEQWINNIFVEDTYENEVAIFASDIDNVIDDKVLNNKYKTYTDDEEEDEDEYETWGDDEDVYKEFFLNGFDNGIDIWDYILLGKNIEVLDTIPESSLKAISKLRNLKMHDRLNYYGDDLDDFMSPLIDIFYDKGEEVNGIIININQEYPDGKNIILRALDIIFRINGKKALDKYTIDLLVGENNICNISTITKRYSDNSIENLKKSITNLMNPLLEDNMSKNQLDQIHSLYESDPSIWKDILSTIISERSSNIDDDIKAAMPKLAQTTRATGSQLLSVSYICWKEQALFPNENTEVLIKFFTDHFWESFMYEIANYSNINSNNKAQDIKHIQDYCIGAAGSPPPKEILMKLMTTGPSSLSPEEKLIFDEARKASQPKSKDEISDIMANLFLNKKIDDELGIQNIRLFRSSEIKMLLASILFGVRGLPMMYEKALKKAFHIIIDLAPVKTLHSCYKAFQQETVYNNDNNTLNTTEYLDILDKIQVPLKYIKAWEIFNIYKKNQYKEVELNKADIELIKAYANRNTIAEDKDTMWGRIEQKEKDALKEALQYVDQRSKVEFLDRVNIMFPSEEYRIMQKKRFKKALEKFCDKNIVLEAEIPYNLTPEETNTHITKCEKAFILINDYILNDSNFEIIESEVMPLLNTYISDDIDEHIWNIEETQGHRALYMLARFGHMNRVYDYWRTWYDANDSDITSDFYYLLIKIGLEESYALHFLLKHYQSVKKVASFEENSFAQAFQEVYKNANLYTELSKIPDNLAIFALREINADIDMTPVMLEFTNHPKKKFRDEAKILLKHNYNNRLTNYAHLL